MSMPYFLQNRIYPLLKIYLLITFKIFYKTITWLCLQEDRNLEPQVTWYGLKP